MFFQRRRFFKDNLCITENVVSGIEQRVKGTLFGSTSRERFHADHGHPKSISVAQSVFSPVFPEGSGVYAEFQFIAIRSHSPDDFGIGIQMEMNRLPATVSAQDMIQAPWSIAGTKQELRIILVFRFRLKKSKSSARSF